MKSSSLALSVCERTVDIYQSNESNGVHQKAITVVEGIVGKLNNHIPALR